MTNRRKKQCVMQKHKSNYNVQYAVIRQSRIDRYHVFCLVCSADIGVAHGGIGDVKKHVLSLKHMSCNCAQFFPPSSDTSVINAEVLFTEFLVEHNVAFAASEHAGPLFRWMFPDSDIARKYGCGARGQRV